jgi:hypothetical protein
MQPLEKFVGLPAGRALDRPARVESVGGEAWRSHHVDC